MDEVPGKFLTQIGQAMEQTAERVVERHEKKRHPPKHRPFDRRPLEIVPYDEVPIDDEQLDKAVRLNREQGLSVFEISEILGVPVWALERAMADLKFRWERHLYYRSTRDA